MSIASESVQAAAVTPAHDGRVESRGRGGTSRILAYTLSAPGHLFPVVSTLVELRRRGHDVVVVAGTPAREAVECAGLRWRAASAEGELTWKAPRSDDDHEQERRKRAAMMMRQQGEHAAADLEQAIAAERPDVLLVDPVLGASVAAEASGLPWALAAHSPLLIPTRRARSLGPGNPPPAGILGHVRDWLEGVRQRRMRDRHLPLVNQLRVSRGLDPLRHIWHGTRRAPLVLAYTAEPFEYPRKDWPSSVRFVGPGIWEAPAESPEWLAETGDTPLVLVSTSSIHQAEDTLVEAAFAALADQPVQVVATIPVTRIPAHVPANFRVERYIPHAAVLERAACVVCHGGFGTTQKSLAAGVPVVVVPFGSDQFEVARRVEAAGAGVRLPASELTPERLREAVQRAMECRPGAERVAAAFRRTGGAGAAADAIEALLPVA